MNEGKAYEGHEKYQLSPDENIRIFHKWIVPDLLENVPSQKEPLLSVVIAQHGAGKTQLAKRAIMPVLEAKGGFVDIDSDLYKRYHPAYDDLMAESDTEMARHTGPDGQHWMRQALQYARDNRKHTLVQETSQKPPFLVDMVNTYRESGFEVGITALGVAEAISRQGILRRYHEQRSTNGAGRIPPIEKVQASLKGVLDFAEMAEQQRIADKVQVIRRDTLESTYSNTLVNGEWTNKPAFREAIENERMREWTMDEWNDFIENQHTLTKALRDDPKLHKELGDIAKLLSTLPMAVNLQKIA